MRDIYSSLKPVRVLSPASVADNTAQVGQIIDHQGFDSALYIIQTGSLGDAACTFTTLLEEGDTSNLAVAAAVADSDMVGTEALASFTQADDDEVFKLGYIGSKRYTRLTITPADNATASLLSAVCVLGNAEIKPVA